MPRPDQRTSHSPAPGRRPWRQMPPLGRQAAGSAAAVRCALGTAAIALLAVLLHVIEHAAAVAAHAAVAAAVLAALAVAGGGARHVGR